MQERARRTTRGIAAPGTEGKATKRTKREPRMVKRSVDYSILVATIILVCFGILMVYSASYYTAENSKIYQIVTIQC